jgi:hypothetical protein
VKLINFGLDELIQSLVRHWPRQARVRVECPGSLGDWSGDRRSAILIDAEHVPPGSVPRGLAWLDGVDEGRRVIVDGNAPTTEELPGRGVAVFPRLRARLLQYLLQRIRSCEIAWEESLESGYLTWVNLV